MFADHVYRKFLTKPECKLELYSDRENKKWTSALKKRSALLFVTKKLFY